ncbi:GTP cyclohydrolase II [Pochonia chlamydosporia 170]|uniref:GTP cyclohydrolase II n=1 Tax=Pochonia chlamydosporia 170 TaxID=1380566 RepID=A0A179FT51_METCM|nr:GTP cyclohydrolase II [Pochonia chlamydosporia 170]OAQ68273.2 GTP cyclohydrolase II [Pochonia chlamydosporia 170]
MDPATSDPLLLDSLRQIQQTQAQLLHAVQSLTERSDLGGPGPATTGLPTSDSGSRTEEATENEGSAASLPVSGSRTGFTSRIVLTGGSYSIYYALAVASKELDIDHRPDFTNTEPATQIGPFKQWGDSHKIVAMDPWGHLTPWTFKSIIEQENVDLRPTIAITKAHMKLPELEESVKAGRLVPDGKVCLNNLGELAVTKFAVEPVWYLPGVAARFGIDEATLRRSLFEHTGGSYPELITRGDIKVFLPPIGGLTVYCFGDPEKMSDENVRLSLRIHDECNGSDVFGSDICTCRPYLIFGIEEAVKEAQNGGSGVVIYFRKEGRALGEVTKSRVAEAYPTSIPILERVELPEELIPADSRVEIDAKITAGYFTAGKRLTAEELQSVQGRMWEDIDH